MFWNRFYELCNSNNKKPLHIVKELGLATGSITKWKNGAIPGGAILLLISDYFGVSIDYLLGKSEKPANEGELEDNVIVLHRDGKAVRKEFSKENMDMIFKMIDAVPEKPKDI